MLKLALKYDKSESTDVTFQLLLFQLLIFQLLCACFNLNIIADLENQFDFIEEIRVEVTLRKENL